jgi:hypothetical protein
VKSFEFRKVTVACNDGARGIYVNRVDPHHKVFASDVVTRKTEQTRSLTHQSLHPVLGPFPFPLTALNPPTEGMYSLVVAEAGEAAVGG